LPRFAACGKTHCNDLQSGRQCLVMDSLNRRKNFSGGAALPRQGRNKAPHPEIQMPDTSTRSRQP